MDVDVCAHLEAHTCHFVEVGWLVKKGGMQPGDALLMSSFVWGGFKDMMFESETVTYIYIFKYIYIYIVKLKEWVA